jgi:hypothetical protein
MKRTLFAPLGVLIVFLASCASTVTSQNQYVEAEAFVKQRNFNAAVGVIEAAQGKEYKEKEKVLYYLDIGMLYHYAGMYSESNEALTEAEYAIEELYTNSISKSIGSAVLNDNAQDYKGEVYEDLYINIFKSLNFIGLGNMESALVEVRRVNLKLEMLQDKYNTLYDSYNSSGEEQQAEIDKITNHFHNSALARYMGTILYRSMGDYDDARIDREFFNQSYLTQPVLYPFPMTLPPDDKPRSDTKIPVNFFAFTGQSPTKRSITYYLDSTNHFLYFTTVEQDKEDYLKKYADINAIFVPGLGNGFHMKLQFPRMERRGIDVSDIRVYANDDFIMNLALTEDMENVAETTFTNELPLIVASTITRAIVKGVVKEVGQSTSDAIIDDQVGGIGGMLLKFAVNAASDVAVDATENADLRVSNFFPAKAYTGEVYLTPGTYDLRLEYYNKGNLLFTDNLGKREINSGSSIFESNFMF